MITVLKKKDGLWLSFTSKSGKFALINVEAMAQSRGPIVRDAIVEACQEMDIYEEEV